MLRSQLSVGLLASVAERLSYVGESLRDSLNPKIKRCCGAHSRHDPLPPDRNRIVPRRNDIKKILIIGSGPIVIGQACEFDYSGAQACKALREEGYVVVLVNSNPATIMTDPDMADRTYIEPLSQAQGAWFDGQWAARRRQRRWRG